MGQYLTLINLLIPLVLLVLGYLFGTLLEQRHRRSLREREQHFLNLPAVTFDELDPDSNPDYADYRHCQFVNGSVVISVDYFKRFLAGLRNIFGGRVSSYETLIDRARREAVLRLKESARGAHSIANVRIETSTLSPDGGLGSVEVHAYGTALFRSQPATVTTPDELLKYKARTADSTVNLPTRHPLVDMLWLLGSLIGLSMVLFMFSGLIVNALVRYIPSTADNDLPGELLEQIKNSLGRTIVTGELHNNTLRLFNALTEYLPEDDLREHTLLIIDDPTVNALAAPGGIIVVFKGLLEQAESENEVALILAHELGHLYYKHHWQRLGRGLFFGTIMTVLAGRQDAFQAQLSMAPLSGLQQSHNRADESQSDQFALEIVCRRYGHAGGALDFFVRHQQTSSASEALSAFFMTHPLSAARVSDLQAWAQELDCGSGVPTPWLPNSELQGVGDGALTVGHIF